MLFKNISLGVYYPGNSLLHRLQARTKLLLLVWFTIILFVANQRMGHFTPYVVLVVLVCIGVVLSGISPRHVWQRMWLLTLFAVIGAIQTVFFPSDISNPLSTLGPFPLSYAVFRWALLAYFVLPTAYILVLLLPFPACLRLRQNRWLKRFRIPLILLTAVTILFFWSIRNVPASHTFPLGPIVITRDNVWSLATFFGVFLVLYALSLLLTMTTTPVALIEGLTFLLTPLRWLKLPVDEFALMTLLALRFIPTLIEEVEQLIKAQASRGADFAHGPLRDRIQSLAALFLPLVQGTLRRAADLATALEARGYEVEGRPTPMHETSFARADYLMLVVVVLVTLGALVL